MINYDDLKTKPKEFLAVTGLTHEEFGQLLTAFAQIFHDQTAKQTAEGEPRRRQPGGGTKGKLSQVENKLLFILAYQKGYELQTFLALHFGLSQPQANYWIHRLLPVLQKALETLKCLPQRDASAVADLLGPHDTPPDLLLDGTERRRQRPQDASRQKENYSGKKKRTRTKT